MTREAYIALGSNQGDRQLYMFKAIKSLQLHPQITITKTSSIYETNPVGYTDQDQFLNMVIKVNTDLSALDLLTICQHTEEQLGRKREIRWGPRTIDLDILLYNQENIETEQLIVPHPRMLERAFVMVPLLEIDQHVVLGKGVDSSSVNINKLIDREGVHVWKRRIGEDVFELFES
ncbi:2-amino-4-hydroxy-6-hydroxymethyldihydropteridine diphosphokinase [Cytobacillus sp. IB215316]|uniref:2-amino-4-hydroxy-6- hydroxymethyldihydropteridine diphosphokinase n=1 Tax=Cytobacillus sp. IB215316 TaxID=3097354 RepID=UPI002A0AA222|nr:2-amino-4-hydroxy-6-hydroxymethyldihydropteridine diphosphokinase [Cytobacillus sp. IB215316]MDX8363163.1 2-amino-4-hydroxy-6-hydroxymethyldihydropteridine diphosphokinase [Cytobacillus sp. IB215316]